MFLKGEIVEEMLHQTKVDFGEESPVSSTETITVKSFGGLQVRPEIVVNFQALHANTASIVLASSPGCMLNLGAVLPLAKSDASLLKPVFG